MAKSLKCKSLNYKQNTFLSIKCHGICLTEWPTRICASLGLRVKFKTLFMRDEEKHGQHFDLPLFCNTQGQKSPGGLLAFSFFNLGATHGQ